MFGLLGSSACVSSGRACRMRYYVGRGDGQASCSPVPSWQPCSLHVTSVAAFISIVPSNNACRSGAMLRFVFGSVRTRQRPSGRRTQLLSPILPHAWAVGTLGRNRHTRVRIRGVARLRLGSEAPRRHPSASPGCCAGQGESEMHLPEAASLSDTASSNCSKSAAASGRYLQLGLNVSMCPYRCGTAEEVRIAYVFDMFLNQVGDAQCPNWMRW